jgi:uncharacterized membrane protein YgcG
MFFVMFLSLIWLYYLVAWIPSYAAEKNPKQLSAWKTTLAYIVGCIISYLMVIVSSKLMKKKGGQLDGMRGGMGMDDSSFQDSEMSSPGGKM